MRAIAYLLTTMLLASCATQNWYNTPPSATTARLRVVAIAPGNTYFVAATDTRCAPSPYKDLIQPGDRPFGIFHEGGSQAIPASTRGWHRKLQMPGAERLDAGHFSEQLVPSEQPIPFRATNYSLSSAASTGGFCHVVGIFAAERGKDYELVFRRERDGCSARFYELVADSRSGVERKERPFIESPRNCEFGA